MGLLLAPKRWIQCSSFHRSSESSLGIISRYRPGPIWSLGWFNLTKSPSKKGNSGAEAYKENSNRWHSKIFNGFVENLRLNAQLDEFEECPSFPEIRFGFLWMADGLLHQMLFRWTSTYQKIYVLPVFPVRKCYKRLVCFYNTLQFSDPNLRTFTMTIAVYAILPECDTCQGWKMKIFCLHRLKIKFLRLVKSFILLGIKKKI